MNALLDLILYGIPVAVFIASVYGVCQMEASTLARPSQERNQAGGGGLMASHASSDSDGGDGGGD